MKNRFFLFLLLSMLMVNRANAVGISPSPATGSGSLSGSAGGDLSGTYPNPTVATIGGQTPGSAAFQPTNAFDAAGAAATAKNYFTALTGYLNCNGTGCTGASTIPISAGGTGASTPPITAYRYTADGDSITYGQGPTSTLAAWSYLAVQDWNMAYNNYGITGEQACDMGVNETFKYSNPTLSYPELFTMMIGTNDAYYKGATANYQANVYQPCHQAALAWLSIPLEFKIMGQAATQTGAWTNATTPQSGIGISSTTNGSTASFSITSQGGPLYIWYNISDGNGGAFSYALDGGSAATVNAFTSPSIATNNGGATGIALIRIPGIPAGTHTVLITVMSATSASNVVGIWAVGTAPQLAYAATSTVLSAGVPYEQTNQNSAYSSAYNTAAQADQALLAGDGLPIRFVNVRAYVNSSTDMADIFHPNNSGSKHYRDAFEAVGQISRTNSIVQIGSVNYTTMDNTNQLPTATTRTGGNCVYTTAGNDYCNDFGSINSTYVNEMFAGPNGGLAFGIVTNPYSGQNNFTPWMLMKSGMVGINNGSIYPSYPLDVTGITRSSGVISGGTKFTASGCSVSATAGGASAGTYTSGTAGTCTTVITLGGLTAPNGWDCRGNDRTAGTVMPQTASSATTATLSGTTASGDTVSFSCTGY